MIKRVVSSLILFLCVVGFSYVNSYAQNESNSTSAVLKGKVVESSTGNPVSDVEVQLKDTDMSATTDSTGYFEFTDLKPGKYTIYIDSDGYETYQNDVDLSNGDVEVAIKLDQATSEDDESKR